MHTLERYTKLALDTWNEDGQAGIRFEYKGFWNAQDDDDASNPKLIIAAAPDKKECGFADACAWHKNCGPNGCKNAHIRMKAWKSLGGGTKKWGFIPPGAGVPGFADYPGTLIHELGHVLGLDHPSGCGQNTNVGVMACGTGCDASGDMRYLRRDDIDGVLARYSWKNVQPTFRSSADALSWPAGTPAMPNYYPDTRFSSVSVNQWPDDQFYLAFPYGHNANWATYSSGQGWSARKSLEWTVHGNTWKPVAIAIDRFSPNYVAAAWLAEESHTNDKQKIRWALSQDEGGTWKYGYFKRSGKDVTTRRGGISAGWDPLTATWIFSWLNDNNRLTFQTLKTSGPSGTGTDTNLLSIDAAGVACSNAVSTQPENCIVTFGSSGPWGPCLQYVYGHVDSSTGNFVPKLPEHTWCYYVYQTPYVAADPDNSNYPFVVTFRQAGNVVYTLRKPALQSAPWHTERSFVVTPHTLSASLGFYESSSGTGKYWNIVPRSYH